MTWKRVKQYETTIPLCGYVKVVDDVSGPVGKKVRITYEVQKLKYRAIERMDDTYSVVNTHDELVAWFYATHPDSKAGAQAEAARLNALEESEQGS